MKHTDEQIREIFSQKLGAFESDVPDGLWESIGQNLPKAATSASSVVAGAVKTTVIKWVAITIAAAVAVVGTLTIATNPEDTEKVEKDSTEINKTTRTEALPSPLEVNKQPLNDDQTEQTASQKNLANQKSGIETVKVMERSDEVHQAVTPITRTEIHNDVKPDYNLTPERQKPTHLEEPIPTFSENAGSGATAEVDLTNAKFSVVTADRETRSYFFMPEHVDGMSYIWDFGDGDQSTEMSPLHSFANDGDYEVKLRLKSKSGENLNNAKSLSVYAPGKIEVPTIFTPNGDGKNDYFDYLEKSSDVSFTYVLIRDNTGRDVFESYDESLWDGTDKAGNYCESGGYQFYIKALDKNQQIREKRGIVYLQR